MNDLIDIFNYFGYETQRRKLIEEVNEFLDEILLFEKGIGDIEKVEEEMADIVVLLEQFKTVYELSSYELENIVEDKIYRTKERIRAGYYERNK
jgi:NTP pyrophosphatase (non-canonical NTP hydrolase)